MNGFKIEQDLSEKNESIIHGEKVFKCDVGSKSFQNNGDMKQHIELVHRGKAFKCVVCPSSFTEKGNLKKHIEWIHEVETEQK